MKPQRPDADAWNLERFVTAQAVNYDEALAELRAGRKRTHWMWYVFPQVAGLGTSGMAVKFAISGRPEAEAYLSHALLGARLRECTAALLGLPPCDIGRVMGFPDDLKLRSSMTLFAEVCVERSLFEDVLARYFEGVRDSRTLELLDAGA